MKDRLARVCKRAEGRAPSRPKSRNKTGRVANKTAPRGISVPEYCSRVWEALDCPHSLSCYLLALNGEWEQLVRRTVDPLSFLRPSDFYRAYQAVKLASKYPYFDTGIDKTAVAYRKFIQAEVQCKLTNARFRDAEMISLDGRLRSIIFDRMQRKIASVLGPVPQLSELDFSFGPGASYGVRGNTSAHQKVELTALECTHTLVPLLSEFLGEFPGWITATHAEVRLIPGSELCTVPKDATTERSICIEPNLNGLGQKGIGGYIRDRLLRYGIDLRDQSINQRLAQRAFSEALATVDFASASDTIAYTLVWNLLPPEWAELLDSFRCPSYTIDGQWYTFQKFSSMGNAYTFELETLIFYCMASAVCEELGISTVTGVNLAVYGDDVIIPRESFHLFKEVSEYCGFALNDKKSFAGGAFFESCGYDYFQGTLVTPYRLKEHIYEPEQHYLAANNLVRILERLAALEELDYGSLASHSATAGARSATHMVDIFNQYYSVKVPSVWRNAAKVLADCHRWIRRQTGSGWLVFGPASATDTDGYHDIVDVAFHAPWDYVTPRYGTFGYRFKRLAIIPNPVLPPGWYDDDGEPKSFTDRHYETAAQALYAAQSIKSPINGWLTDDTPESPDVKGYAVRGNVRRKTIWAWSSDWTQLSSCAWFYTQVQH